ncbi:cystathionine beta-lyase [Sphingomonas daechungensis]|uniref:cystathionine beta-lyase n=1 Tax=Sphingomonas daechungensis TaxID=1176646 RepID=UPI003784C157
MTLKKLSDADRIETIATHAGRDPSSHGGAINPPIFHASTILYEKMDAYDRRRDLFFEGVGYGLYNTPSTIALSKAVAALEGASHCVIVSSGTAAIATALMSFIGSGAHILVPDTVYGSTRTFCDGVLSKFGVSTTYYDPEIGSGIASLFKEETSLVLLESPGSLTFEVQDVRAISKVAREHGAISAIDATWASPVFLRALDLGVDIAIQSGTKYLSGHSDVMFGTLSTRNEGVFRRLKETAGRFGNRLGGEDCYLALRGIRTLPVRMQVHHATGIELARRLTGHRAVRRVLHPALSGDPGHVLWRRDFTGASGLFGAVLKTSDRAAVAAAVESRRLFKMGSSWGGYESLIVPAYPALQRSVTTWAEDGFVVRIHAGLENIEDLWRDLEEGLDRLPV